MITIDYIQQLFIMYSPVIFTAISMIVQFTKMVSGFKNNVKQITQSPEITELREKLAATQSELAVLQSQLKENIAAQYELINEISKVKKYEVEKNETTKE